MRYKDKKEARVVNEPSLRRPKGVSDEQWNRALDLYEAARKKGDRFPELTVAQAALETGWFKHMSGNYNYFGQKASKSQKGSPKVTKEFEGNREITIVDRFRDYDSLDKAIEDRLAKWGKKYENSDTIDDAISRIWSYDPKTGKGKGYATDINYDNKIKKILGMMGVSSEEKVSKDRFRQRRSLVPQRDELEAMQVEVDNTAVAPPQTIDPRTLIEPMVINDVDVPTQGSVEVERARDTVEEEQNKFEFAKMLISAAQVQFVEPVEDQQTPSFKDGGKMKDNEKKFMKELARVYRRKNSKQRRALKFRTPKDTGLA